jgi:hypothetical protein
MKAVVPVILRLYGFKPTLIVNALISSVMIAACAAFTPGTPIVIIMAILIASGFFRSLEFTCINTISYADIDHRRMSRATSIAAVGQQLSVSTGVAVGAVAVELAVRHAGTGEITASNFQPAFLFVAVISALSVIFFMKLAPNAGEELTNRTPGPTEPADQRIG